jgi:hypothetical protein
MTEDNYEVADILMKKHIDYVLAPKLVMIAKVINNNEYIIIDLADNRVLYPTRNIINEVYRKVA